MNPASTPNVYRIDHMGGPQLQDRNSRKLDRDELLRLMDIGSQVDEWKYVRRLAVAWLAIYPGDLGINKCLAQAWLEDDRPAPARTILERLVSLDPEYLAAWELLERIYRDDRGEDWKQAIGCIQILGGEIEESQEPPIWAAWLRDAYQRLLDGRLEGAERSLQHAVTDQRVIDLPIYAVICARIARARKEEERIVELVNNGRERWPGMLLFDLLWAEMSLHKGIEQRSKAVEILHRCASEDALGQVPKRLWGERHEFLPLWPEKMDIYYNGNAPAAVASRLGMNGLESGPLVEPVGQDSPSLAGLVEDIKEQVLQENSQPKSKLPLTEDLRKVEQEFERLAKQVKNPTVSREDWRFPVYVAVSSRFGLTRLYGEQTTEILSKEMDALVAAFKRKQGWDGCVFLPDDISSCEKLGLSATAVVSEDGQIDAWKIKLALADLDAVLMKSGRMIGAVLIVGGPEVVPFHRLPNPADDNDTEVLSDNPYATLDSNYYVPEWPVGRLPGGAGSDAGLLMAQLRQLGKNYSKITRRGTGKGLPARFWKWFLSRLRRQSREQAAGLTAAVWRQSSVAVFRLIGRDRNLLISPPQAAATFEPRNLLSSPLGYFNLHGLADSSEWYGQRDTLDNHGVDSQPDYPVALRPSDLSKNGHTPQVVFSEACYGANIVSKRDDEAISLKFLSLGTAVVVGSTCVSYGSVFSPLIGADLLASIFWRLMRQGLTAGQALMQAKIELAQEMNKRQGYLDGEDQKTLISFILLGDPMAIHNADGYSSKRVVRLKQVPQMRMIADDKEQIQAANAEMIKTVKSAVEKYLPGLESAEIRVRSWKSEQVEGRKKQVLDENRTVFTIAKQVRVAQFIHPEVARVTLNSHGKMVKLAISR